MSRYKVRLNILIINLLMTLLCGRVLAESSIPETGAEAIGDAIGGLGSSIVNYQNVTNQRKNAISSLRKQLSNCGACARRGQLESDLSEVLEADRKIHEAEGFALQQMGIRGYKNFAEFKKALYEGITNGPSIQQTLANQRFDNMRLMYCKVISGEESIDEEISTVLEKYDSSYDCLKENSFEFLVVQQQAARHTCYGVSYNKASEKFIPEYDRKKYAQCMKEVDIGTNMCLFLRKVKPEYDVYRSIGGDCIFYAGPQDTGGYANIKKSERYAAGPIYPRRALMRKIEGWVELLVTVKPDGTVEDAVVQKAEPQGIFERSALKYVLNKDFPPIFSDDQLQKQEGISYVVEFKLDESAQ